MTCNSSAPESKAIAFPNDLDELVDRVIQLGSIRVIILGFSQRGSERDRQLIKVEEMVNIN